MRRLNRETPGIVSFSQNISTSPFSLPLLSTWCPLEYTWAPQDTAIDIYFYERAAESIQQNLSLAGDLEDKIE